MLSTLLWRLGLSTSGLYSRLNEIARFRGLAPEAQRRRIAASLVEQARAFRNLADAPPEWARLAEARDDDHVFALFSELPILTKADFRGRFRPERILAQSPPALRRKLYVSTTGGSTGEPTPFCHDLAMVRAKAACNLDARLRMGWRPGMPLLIVWGSERDIGKMMSRQGRLRAWAKNEHIVDGYELGDETIERFTRVLERHPRLAVYGFSSMLEFVARRFKALGRRVAPGHVVAAWNGGELLLPQQVELFKEVFHVPILNLYGGRETGAMASQVQENGPIEVIRPFVLIEVIGEDGRPCAPGETGRVVVTSLVCKASPFLRYEIGDSATVERVGGAGVESLAAIGGRLAGIMTLANGRQINALFWNHLFKDFFEVEQFQVAIRSSNRVEIRLKGAGMSPERRARLDTILESKLEGMDYAVSWVAAIQPTSQGKLVQVVREE